MPFEKALKQLQLRNTETWNHSAGNDSAQILARNEALRSATGQILDDVLCSKVHEGPLDHQEIKLRQSWGHKLPLRECTMCIHIYIYAYAYVYIYIYTCMCTPLDACDCLRTLRDKHICSISVKYKNMHLSVCNFMQQKPSGYIPFSQVKKAVEFPGKKGPGGPGSSAPTMKGSPGRSLSFHHHELFVGFLQQNEAAQVRNVMHANPHRPAPVRPVVSMFVGCAVSHVIDFLQASPGLQQNRYELEHG